jgi:NitT/TauT family transport system substrate-binding protein
MIRNILRLSLLAGAVVFAAVAPAQAQQKPVWKHATVAAKADAGFIFMVDDGKFDDKYGVDVQMVQFSGDSLALRALLAGEVDSFEAIPAGAMAANSRGADTRIIGCHWLTIPHVLFVAGDSKFKSLSDLKGARIGVSAPGALPDMTARAMIARAGIDPKSVTLVNAGSDADRLKALVAGTIDVAPSSNEFILEGKKYGVKPLVAMRDAAPDLIRSCVVTTQKVLDSKRDAAVKFLAAEMAAFKFALDPANAAKVDAISAKEAKLSGDDPRLAFVRKDAVESNSIDPTFPFPMDKLKFLMDLTIQVGQMQKPIDLDKMVVPAVRDDALKLAAAKK